MRSNMSKEESIIEKALASVRQEMQVDPCTTSSIAPNDQLLRVENELNDMLEDLSQGRSLRDRSGLGRMVVDSWPLQHELTKQVCAAVQAYSAAGRVESE
jgi:hypothetical protein